MIVDSSAVTAVVMNEPEREAFIRLMAAEPVLRMSTSTYSEIIVVIANKVRSDPAVHDRREQDFEELLDVHGIAIEAFTLAQAQRSRVAYRHFGRGSGHPAKLNFGDCFTYALAAELDEPILCKGDDFVHTDRAVVRA